jgi:phosphatidylinositol alpha-1,6-mannosyltransferase
MITVIAKVQPLLVFGMTGAYGVCGGIATANKNILHALVRLTERRGCQFNVVSLLERDCDRPAFLPPRVGFRGCRGDKVAFSLTLLRSAASRPTMCFDHVSLALPVLPLAATGVVRTIVFGHGSEVGRRMKRLSRWSLRTARKVFTNSSFTLRNARQYLDWFDGEACPLGLSPEFELNVTIPDAGNETIQLTAVDGQTRQLTNQALLLVARIDSSEGQKGHAELISAVAGIRTDFPNVQAVLAGPGNGRAALADLARRTGIADAVFLPGLVTQETLQALYHGCYAFVMPSRQEGFGLVYLEAMNYGKACVGCYDDGAEEVIVPGETGWLVRNPANQAELQGVLQSLLGNPAAAAQRGVNGFRRLHERFTSQHHQQRLISCLDSVL